MRVEVGCGLAIGTISTPVLGYPGSGMGQGKAVSQQTVTSPLTPVSLNNASASVGAAAHTAECRKHAANETRCQELGWLCIPLAVETYGNRREGGSEYFFPACFSAFHQPGPNCLPQHVTCEVCCKGHHGKGSCPRVG